MKKTGTTAPFMISFIILVTSAIGNSQQPALPYYHQITVGEKKIDVHRERLTTLRRKILTTPASKSSKASRAEIEALANEFGLMKKTDRNPELTFDAKDIEYWESRKLGQPELALEFAARRLVLEEADAQGIRIPGKAALLDAVRQAIRLIQDEQKEEQNRLITVLVCTGSTSQEFAKQSWEGLVNNPEKALACADRTIKKWTRQADDQQAKATNQGCSDTPQASDLKPYSASYWALTDVASSWFMKGEVLAKQKNWPEAKAAYKTVIDKYRCAFAWDPDGWFWRVADGAQEKYDEIRLN